MTSIAPRIVAWGSFAVSVLLALIGAAVASADLAGALDRGTIAFAVPSLAFCATGALVASRLPRNPVGWLLLAFGASGVLGLFSEEYVRVGLVAEPGSLPAPGFAVTMIAISPTMLALAFLYFPNGRLPSSRWRPVAGLVVVAGVAAGVAGAFATNPVVTIPEARNPITNPALSDAMAPVLSVAQGLLPVIFLSCAASLIVRFRRTRGDERQQIKWFAFAAALIASFLIIAAAGESLVGAEGAPSSDRVAIIVFPVLLSAAPAAIGLAILRYRLYDIDRIISRTLSYAVLTAVLAGAYLLAVLVLQSLMPLSEDSPLIVATSTLAVVAAFGPLRSRIKHVVDRRFNRSRYDAEHTIAAFGARLRSEVELDALAHALADVIDRTVAPSHMSLWLRQERSG